MTIVHTDGENADFIELCILLDANLDKIVGRKFQREKYHQYNVLHDIHDVVIIYIEENPVACGSFKKYDTDIAEIKRVFVKKEFRGQGLSKILMRELEQKARNAGYKKLYLETGELLAASMHLYSSIGFTIIDNYGPYKDMKESICMEKKIG